MLELAIVENVQRADLNPLEEAMAFDYLVKQYEMKHKEIAKKVGLSRPAVANKIRLLKLPDPIKKGLLEGKITEGHARAILGLNSTQAMLLTYRRAVKDGLSVRAIEQIVRRINKGAESKRPTPKQKLDKYAKNYQSKLQRIFGTKVKIKSTKKGGKIIIPFTNKQELEKLYSHFAT